MAIRSLSLELDLDAGKFTASMASASGETIKFSQVIDDADRRLRKVEGAVAGPLAKMRDFTVILAEARRAVDTVNSFMLGWIETMVKSTAQIERTSALLRGLSKAVDEVGQKKEAQDSLDFIFDMAQRAPFSLHALTDAFVKLKSAGLDPLDGTLNGVVQAVANFGGSDQQLERAALAIQQMAGKGVISMEELRRQLGEAVPTAINMMAAGMGMSYAQLTKEIANGNVQAKSAIDKMVGMFNLAYGSSSQRMMETFTGKLSVMKTAFTQLAMASAGLNRDGTTAEGGFFAEVKRGLDAIISTAQSPEFKQLGVEVGRFLTGATSSLIGFGQGIAGLAAHLPVLTLVKDAFLAMAVVMTINLARSAVAAVISAFSTLITTFRGMGVATVTATSQLGALFSMWRTGTIATTEWTTALALGAGALRAFGAAMLNAVPVVGTLLAILYTAADAFGLFKDKVKEANQAVNDFRQSGFTTQDNIDKQAESVRNAVSAYDELTKKIKEGGEIRSTGTESAWHVFTPAELERMRQEADAAKKVAQNALKDLADMKRSFFSQQTGNAGTVYAESLLKNGPLAALDAQEKQLQTAFDQQRAELQKSNADKDSYAKATAEFGAKMKALNEAYISDLNKTIQREQAIAAKMNKNSPDFAAKQAAITRLDQELQRRLTESRSIENILGPNVLVNGNKPGKLDPATQMLNQMREQAASISAQLKEGGKNAAKIGEALNIDPRLAKISPQMKKDLMDAAATLDGLQKKLAGKRAFDNLEDEAAKQAAATSGLRSEMEALLSATDGSTASNAKYAASLIDNVKRANDFSGTAQEVADAAARSKLENDKLVESNKNLGKIWDEITGAGAQAQGLFDDLAAGNDHASLTLERYKRTLAELVQNVLPEARVRAKELADQALASFSQVEALKAAQDMRGKIKEINADLEKDTAQRSHIATQQEVDDMYRRVDWAKLTAEQRKMVEKDFYDYVDAMRRRDAENSKGPLHKMADQWAMLGQNMEEAMTGWVGSFVDGLVRGTLSFKDFLKEILAGIAKIILQALIARAIIAALGAFGGGGSTISTPGTGASIPWGDSIGASGAGIVMAHSGGVIGKDKGMGSLRVDPSIFADAVRYHIGGVAGLRPGEVPAILEEGEGVFTKEQMKELGQRGNAVPNVEVNVINQSGVGMSAQKKGQHFDAKGLIVDVVVDALSKPGKMRDAVQGANLK